LTFGVGFFSLSINRERRKAMLRFLSVLVMVMLAGPALADSGVDMGFANPDGSQDTFRGDGSVEMEFKNSDGSVDKFRSDGAVGMGFANPDGSQDTFWVGEDNRDDDEGY
jgi:hypothetical protein